MCGDGYTAHVCLLETQKTLFGKKKSPSHLNCATDPRGHLSSNFQPVFFLSSGDARLDFRDRKGLYCSKITTRNFHLPHTNGALKGPLQLICP